MPIYLKTDFSDKGDLILMLGGACNMSCRHCAQLPVRDVSPDLHPCISDKVWHLMDSYIQYALHHTDKVRHIYFYGGESLLYWDLIVSVVDFFFAKYDLLSSKYFCFGTQSNGLLLTQDKVDYLNSHHMTFGFSYDAPYPFAVRGYVSDKICDLVCKIHSYSIAPTSSNAYNYDVLLANRCLRKKFPEATMIRNTFNISYSFSMSDDIIAYDWAKFSDALKRLRIAAQLGDKFALSWMMTYFKFYCEKRSMPIDMWVQRCLCNHSELCITVDGRFSACQNGDFFFGTVDDTLDSLEAKIYSFLESRRSPECKSCRHADICNIHCQLDLRNEDLSFKSCRFYWSHLFDLIKQQLFFLHEPLSVEDRDWYSLQERWMDEMVQVFLSEPDRYEREHTPVPILSFS